MSKPIYVARYNTIDNIRNGRDYPKVEFADWPELKELLYGVWDDITILILTDNDLKDLPSTVGYWPACLRKIYLGRNNITKLPDKPGYWPDKPGYWPDKPGYWPDKLITFSMPKNNLKTLPSTAGYWPVRLVALILFDNSLETLPDKPGYLPKSLEVINISNNFITRIPSTTGYWPRGLMYLNIASNSIPELPINLLDCRWIIKAIIRDNPIISVSPEIKQWLKESITLSA